MTFCLSDWRACRIRGTCAVSARTARRWSSPGRCCCSGTGTTMPGRGTWRWRCCSSWAMAGRRVAAAMELTENYVATLHRRALREGTGGLVRPRGRPGEPGQGSWDQARQWRAAGVGDAEIARRMQVNQSTVLRHLGPAGMQGELLPQPMPKPGMPPSSAPAPGPGRAGPGREQESGAEPGPRRRGRAAPGAAGAGPAPGRAGSGRTAGGACFPGMRA